MARGIKILFRNRSTLYLVVVAPSSTSCDVTPACHSLLTVAVRMTNYVEHAQV